MRTIINGFIVLLALVVQSTLIQYIQFGGIKPNILVVVIISVAIWGGIKTGAVVGLFAGAVYDVAFGKMFGASMLMGLLLGLCVGTLNRRLYKENLLVVILITFIFSFGFEAVIAFFTIFKEKGVSLIVLIKDIVLKEALYNSIFVIFIHYSICWVNNKMVRSERVRGKKY